MYRKYDEDVQYQIDSDAQDIYQAIYDTTDVCGDLCGVITEFTRQYHAAEFAYQLIYDLEDIDDADNIIAKYSKNNIEYTLYRSKHGYQPHGDAYQYDIFKTQQNPTFELEIRHWPHEEIRVLITDKQGSEAGVWRFALPCCGDWDDPKDFEQYAPFALEIMA